MSDYLYPFEGIQMAAYPDAIQQAVQATAQAAARYPQQEAAVSQYAGPPWSRVTV
jgi:hypothetical protein